MDIAAIKTTLSQRLFEAHELPTHVEACSRFLSPWWGDLSNLQQVTSNGSYRDVATMGFALSASSQNEALATAFVEGAMQLSGRVPFAQGRAPSLEMDGVALFGLAIGYRSLSAHNLDHAWLQEILERSATALKGDNWQWSLVRSAQFALDPNIEIAEIDPTLHVAICERFGMLIDEDLSQRAWTRLVEDIEDSDPSRRAALQGTFLACASALARLPIRGAGVRELIEILEGVSRSMGHWTYEKKQRVQNVAPQKWEIDHEYHVQNLLWTILRPVFPDLVDEETLKKIGHTSPRYDLGVPSLSTIIEVKFLRKRGQAALKDITDEIAADHSLYLRPGTGFTRMLAFIWDETRQTEEYQTLKAGLEQLGGIERIIIIPRPSKMNRNANVSANK
ncbi:MULTISPECIES: hypothetical protein [Alphaproteobacteria]|jgi:hypothetical protein|uniref:PD-(D/E)XK nuclease domain-containing protein n=1 Tax=Alphaproteobacteria TaxID=28211 RepID=UPI0025BA0AF0|nr:hypothetical protein [Hyphomonas sp. UBA4494]|tara:strand:- start:604 stop:1779 length:1176 start_codon:yes stop_codon:yes gene_type:complete